MEDITAGLTGLARMFQGTATTADKDLSPVQIRMRPRATREGIVADFKIQLNELLIQLRKEQEKLDTLQKTLKERTEGVKTYYETDLPAMQAKFKALQQEMEALTTKMDEKAAWVSGEETACKDLGNAIEETRTTIDNFLIKKTNLEELISSWGDLKNKPLSSKNNPTEEHFKQVLLFSIGSNTLLSFLEAEDDTIDQLANLYHALGASRVGYVSKDPRIKRVMIGHKMWPKSFPLDEMPPSEKEKLLLAEHNSSYKKAMEEKEGNKRAREEVNEPDDDLAAHGSSAKRARFHESSFKTPQN